MTLTPTQGGAPIELDYFAPGNGEDLEISNLLANTEYSYVMTLTDFSGNSVTTQSQTFKTSILESDSPQIIVTTSLAHRGYRSMVSFPLSSDCHLNLSLKNPAACPIITTLNHREAFDAVVKWAEIRDASLHLLRHTLSQKLQISDDSSKRFG